MAGVFRGRRCGLDFSTAASGLFPAAVSVAFFVVRLGCRLGLAFSAGLFSEADSVVVEGAVSVFFFAVRRGRRFGFSSVAVSVAGAVSVFSALFLAVFLGVRRGLGFSLSTVSVTVAACDFWVAAGISSLATVVNSEVVSGVSVEATVAFFVVLLGRRFGFVSGGSAATFVSVPITSEFTGSSTLFSPLWPFSDADWFLFATVSGFVAGFFLLLLRGRGLDFSSAGFELSG